MKHAIFEFTPPPRRSLQRPIMATTKSLAVWSVISLALFLAGCSQLWRPSSNAKPVLAPTPVSATVSGASTSGGPGDTATQNRQLVLWLPEFSDAETSNSAGSILSDVFHRFEQENPGVNVDVQIKAETGTASLFNYLRSAQLVAPSILPDVVLLDTQHLWQIADLGLVPSLTTTETLSISDFYQFSLDAVTYNKEMYGIPYAADVIHIVYYQDQLQTAPGTWKDLYLAQQPYLFPGNGSEGYGNAAMLLQYVDAGGQLLEDGSVSSAEALNEVFNFLVEARIRGVIPGYVADLASLDAVWTAFVENKKGMANVSADDYLMRQDAMPQTKFAQVPTRKGLPATISNTWAFAILTHDPAQRQLALTLIDRLLTPSVQGPWSQYVHHLPSRRDALGVWTNPNAYTQFLSRQLETAVAIPNGRAFAGFSHRLQVAQLGLLKGSLTLQEAMKEVTSGE